MPAPSEFLPPSDLADPRCSPDFRPALWPRCVQGVAAEGAEADLHQRRCLEFLTACYAMNLALARLEEALDAGAPGFLADARRAQVAAAREDIERLEDRYAPIGFFGEVASDDAGYVREVSFVRPELPRLTSHPSSYSANLHIPGLAGIPVEELRGDVRFFRWAHGKVDL